MPKYKHPLRMLREKRKISQLQVERASSRIAKALDNHDYFVSRARLQQIETTTSLPSPAKAASLCFLYNVTVEKLYTMLVPPIVDEAETLTKEALEQIPADAAKEPDENKPKDS